MASWRYIADDAVSASYGLAADEYMARRTSGRPVLRLYTYRSHCVLVGRFQQIESEAHRAQCEAEGVAINRRPTGGGAILMGADQLGVAITLPAALVRDRSEGVRGLFARYAVGVTAALGALGIDAEFHRKNDIEVRRRKIAGMGFYFDRRGGLLFHTSLLVDLDVPLMLRMLRTPFEKLSDKAVATVADRITTVRREVGADIALDEVRHRVRSAYEEHLGMACDESAFTDAERDGIETLEREKYLSREWIEQRSLVAEAFGHSRMKTAGGLLEVHLTLSGDHIKAVYITGDFFGDDWAVAEIERRLKRVPATEQRVADVVTGAYADPHLQLPGVPAPALTRVVVRAIGAATGAGGTPGTHGCFVAAGEG